MNKDTKNASHITDDADAVIALSGSEYVREKLAALSGMGPNPLYDQVYAIKLRTKSSESLRNKVKNRRKKVEKKNYKASDATDIVGMRLLSLFASDLPSITRSVLSFIRFCQTPQIALIKGDNINDGIREIIVYKSHQADSQIIYEKIYRYCKSQPIDEFLEDGSKKIDIEDFKNTDKSYSSVHIVVSAISYSGGVQKEVPVEIQIRSIFEDTWAEIDHKLEYKFQEIAGDEIPEDIVDFYNGYKRSLKKLKDRLEDLGSDAEEIRSGYLNILKKISIKNGNVADKKFTLRPIHASDNYERSISLRSSSPDAPLFIKKFTSLLKVADDVRGKVSKDIQNTGEADDCISLISKYIEELSKLQNTFNKKRFFSKSTREELEYFFQMEHAICGIWLFLISDHFYPYSLEHNLPLLENSLSIYYKLENIPRFKEDCFIYYRLGCSYVALGKNETSELFLYKAVDKIAYDERLQGTIFSSAIPHLLSFTIWLRRASLLEMGFRTGNPKINREEQIDIVAESLFWSLYSFYKLEEIKNKPVDILFDPYDYSTRLRGDIINNIIAFTWELRDLCKDGNEFKVNIFDISDSLGEYFEIRASDALNPHRFDFVKFGGEIVEGNSTLQSTVTGLDTLMKYYQLVGNIGKALAISREIATIISGKSEKIADHYGVDIFRYSVTQVERKGEHYVLAKDLRLI